MWGDVLQVASYEVILHLSRGGILISKTLLLTTFASLLGRDRQSKSEAKVERGEPKVEGTITVPYAYPSEVNTKNAENWADSAGQVMFPANDTYYIPNFTLKNAQQDAYINGVVN